MFFEMVRRRPNNIVSPQNIARTRKDKSLVKPILNDGLDRDYCYDELESGVESDDSEEEISCLKFPF